MRFEFCTNTLQLRCHVVTTFLCQHEWQWCNVYIQIYIGNWTELSAIWSRITRVIKKSHDRAAGVLFCNHECDSGPKLHETKFNYLLIICILKLYENCRENIFKKPQRCWFCSESTSNRWITCENSTFQMTSRMSFEEYDWLLKQCDYSGAITAVRLQKQFD